LSLLPDSAGVLLTTSIPRYTWLPVRGIFRTPFLPGSLGAQNAAMEEWQPELPALRKPVGGRAMSESNTAIGVREGDVLAGKYRVDGVLGAGGASVVVAAHHLQLDERVALKFLKPDALSNPGARIRFAREARAAVKITSEHVARVSDVGELENGAPYIVMEFLEGIDLSMWLEERGPLPVDQAVDFVLQACEAVAEAHSFGIVHRDLKPSNLFVVRRNDGLDSIKVLDFGISKITGSGDMAGTNTQILMGTPLYMSPEQMRSSKDASFQSDIWSIGITLYELIAGHAPFSGESFPEICLRTTTDPPPPLRAVRPETPAALEAVIFRCLEKDPKNRYSDVAELALALRDFGPPMARVSVDRIVGILHGSPAWHAALREFAYSPPRDSAVSGSVAPYSRTTGGRLTRGRRVAVGALVGLLLGTSLVLLYRGKSGTSPRPEVTINPPVAVRGSVAPEGLHLTPILIAVPSSTESTTTAEASAPPAQSASTAPSAQSQPSAAPVQPVPPMPPVPTRRVEQGADAGSRRRTLVVDCHPPFYFDADGIRIFKKECVR
jgi:serine/threonine-protein kinase